MSAQSEHSNRVTIATLRKMKRDQQRFVCLTAYDTAFARILDQAGWKTGASATRHGPG